jgi:hypothetical protein
MVRYRHSQIGTLLIAQGALSLAGNVAAMRRKGRSVGRWIGVAVAVATIGVFSRLTVTVDDEAVDVRFWPRFVGRRVALAEIESVAVVSNRWYWGWGIRRIRDGWLFNVQGLRGVELRLTTGGMVRIGSPEPEVLAAAVEGALAEHARSVAV